MPGIEHCEQKRRTIRLSAPQRPFSPAPGSMLPGSPLAASCPEPVARNGLLLARNGCHLSATSIPGSKLSACYFASFQVPFVPPRPDPPLARNRSLVPAFCSPAPAATSRRPPFRGQSSQPATSLPSKSLPCPFGPSAPLPHPRFAPVAAASLPLARCTSTTRFGLPRWRSPLPSGIFASLGIKAFNRFCCLPVHLTNPPDFLSLPAARSG